MTHASSQERGSEAEFPRLYLEDFAVGQVYTAGPVPVSVDDIKAYARQFDPQPFHTDENRPTQPFSEVLWRAGGTRPHSR